MTRQRLSPLAIETNGIGNYSDYHILHRNLADVDRDYADPFASEAFRKARERVESRLPDPPPPRLANGRYSIPKHRWAGHENDGNSD